MTTTVSNTDKMTATIRSAQRVRQYALELAGCDGYSWDKDSTFGRLYRDVREQLLASGVQLVARCDGEHMVLNGRDMVFGSSGFTVRTTTMIELFQPGYVYRELARRGLYAPLYQLG